MNKDNAILVGVGVVTCTAVLIGLTIVFPPASFVGIAACKGIYAVGMGIIL